MRLIIAGSRKADRMRKLKLEREEIRAHRNWHLERAKAMRQEADRLDAYIEANREEYSEREIAEAERASVQLRANAIAEENGACMEKH